MEGLRCSRTSVRVRKASSPDAPHAASAVSMTAWSLVTLFCFGSRSLTQICDLPRLRQLGEDHINSQVGLRRLHIRVLSLPDAPRPLRDPCPWYCSTSLDSLPESSNTTPIVGCRNLPRFSSPGFRLWFQKLELVQC